MIRTLFPADRDQRQLESLVTLPRLCGCFSFSFGLKNVKLTFGTGGGGCMPPHLPGETENARPPSPYLFICGREGDREGGTAAKGRRILMLLLQPRASCGE